MHCWWIVFSFNVSSISSNVDWWSFKTNLRDFSWILFIFLFSPLDVNIQIRGQYENWDLMKEFSKVFLWRGDVNFVILASALSSWLAFSYFLHDVLLAFSPLGWIMVLHKANFWMVSSKYPALSCEICGICRAPWVVASRQVSIPSTTRCKGAIQSRHSA